MPGIRPVNRREVVAGVFATLGASGVQAARSPGVDAIVGVGGHSSIQSALDSVPKENLAPFRILIRKGRWREKLIIEKPFVHLIGEHRKHSVVTFDAYAGQMSPDGQPWGTSRTATILVRAPNFLASNLTIENAFDYIGYLQQAGIEPTGANRAQAVALMLEGTADKVAVRDTDIAGYQDTLFVNSGRSLFEHCKISGTVDFIFGAGRSMFDRCEVASLFRPNSPRMGVIAAPSTLIDQEAGIVFSRCRLTKEKVVPKNSVALGRAWRPTTTFSDGRYGNPDALGMAVYLRCWMDDHIAEEGWDAMQYGARDGSRAELRPEEARFYEFENKGPGARRNARRRQLTALEAEHYARQVVLGEWRP